MATGAVLQADGGRGGLLDGIDGPGNELGLPRARGLETEPQVLLHVSYPSGELALQLRMGTTALVEDLMSALEEPTGTPAEFQRLVFEGRQLGPALSIAEEGLPDGAWITLVRVPPQDGSLHAVQDGCRAVYLLECRAEAGAKDDQGLTPLHCAAVRGFPSVCLALLAPGVDPEVNAVDWIGRTALHIAASEGLLSVCRAVLARSDFACVNARDSSGHTALHAACWEGHASVCRAIVQHPDFAGLHEALELAHEVDSCGNLCEDLLASCNATALAERATDGSTVLHWVAEHGSPRAGEALLSRPGRAALATLSGLKDGRGRTALHLAADRGDEVVCRAVLELEGSAAINATDDRGRTALVCAARVPVPALCLAILADHTFTAVNQEDGAGLTALHYSLQNELAEVCVAIVARPELASANARLENGGTLLHWAASKDHVELCEALAARADFTSVNLQDDSGRTALHCAAEHCLPRACVAVLRHPGFGAADALDLEGRSAFGIAAGLRGRSVNARAAICEAILAQLRGDTVEPLTALKVANQPLYRGQAKLERLVSRYNRERTAAAAARAEGTTVL